jgi:hypothetical protein
VCVQEPCVYLLHAASTVIRNNMYFVAEAKLCLVGVLYFIVPCRCRCTSTFKYSTVIGGSGSFSMRKIPDPAKCYGSEQIRIPNTVNKYWLETSIVACIGREGDQWDCRHHHMCRDESKILFAWAKHAPATTVPENVGFALAEDDHLVLQVNIPS